MKILKATLKFILEVFRLPLLLIGFIFGLILKGLIWFSKEAEDTKVLFNMFIANILNYSLLPLCRGVMYIIIGNENLITKLSTK